MKELLRDIVQHIILAVIFFLILALFISIEISIAKSSFPEFDISRLTLGALFVSQYVRIKNWLFDND